MVRGVDFEVARGSMFALLGSNGAGKTTVVRILSTVLKEDAGWASVGILIGAYVFAMVIHRRKIS